MTNDPPPLPVATPPGWFFDNVNRRQRWWDGIQWAFFDDAAPAPTTHAFPAPPPVRRNGMATASLVLGILSLLLCATIIFPALSLVFGVIGVVKARDRGGVGRGNAVAGIVLGSLTLFFGLLVASLY